MLTFFKNFLLFIMISAGLIYFTGHKISKTGNPSLPVNVKGIPKDLEVADQAEILIIGSGLAEYITPSVERIGSKYSNTFKGGLKVYNWARKNEGIHRTLHKWKSLKTKPLITIYLGGDSEFVETKFKVNDILKIQQNIKRLKDPKISTILSFVPQLQRFLLERLNTFSYQTNLTPNKDYPLKNLKGIKSLKYIEFNLKLYRHLLGKLMREIRESDKSIILIDQPYDFTKAPSKTCEPSKSETITETLFEIKDLQKKGKNQAALNLSRRLSEKALGNAEVFFQRAKLEEKEQNYSAAFQLYELARVFDCEQNASTKATNGIIEQVAESYGHPFISFYRKVNMDFGKSPLFTDGFIPQEKYISSLSNKLELIIDDIVTSME